MDSGNSKGKGPKNARGTGDGVLEEKAAGPPALPPRPPEATQGSLGCLSGHVPGVLSSTPPQHCRS